VRRSGILLSEEALHKAGNKTFLCGDLPTRSGFFVGSLDCCTFWLVSLPVFVCLRLNVVSLKAVVCCVVL
jgi:hypothetical protein